MLSMSIYLQTKDSFNSDRNCLYFTKNLIFFISSTLSGIILSGTGPEPSVLLHWFLMFSLIFYLFRIFIFGLLSKLIFVTCVALNCYQFLISHNYFWSWILLFVRFLQCSSDVPSSFILRIQFSFKFLSLLCFVLAFSNCSCLTNATLRTSNNWKRPLSKKDQNQKFRGDSYH